MFAESGIHCLATNIPCCIFRNREGYRYKNCEDFRNLRDSNGKKRKAGQLSNRSAHVLWKQTQYGLEEIIDDHIPSYLLYDLLVEQNNQVPPKPIVGNTTVNCFHGGKSLFIHSCGKSQGDVILRDTNRLYHKSTKMQSGFTLPLFSSPIRQLSLLCPPSFSDHSHILASSLNEVSLFQTVCLDDELPSESHFISMYNAFKRNVRKEARQAHILEPLQKWTLPVDVLKMSTLASNNYCATPAAVCVSRKGQVYSWSYQRGFHLVNSNPIFNIPDNLSLFDLSITCNPNVVFYSSTNQVFLHDFRSSATSQSIVKLDTLRNGISMTTSNDTISSLLSISHSNLSFDTLACSIDSLQPSLQLFDVRMSSYSLQKSPIPNAHDRMSLFSLSQIDSVENQESNDCKY